MNKPSARAYRKMTDPHYTPPLAPVMDKPSGGNAGQEEREDSVAPFAWKLEEHRASRFDGVQPPSIEFGWHHIPVGYVTLLVGDGGAGKSFFMQSLAHHVGAGIAYLGETVKAQGTVVYVTTEDTEGDLHRREHKIVEAMPGTAREAASHNVILRSLFGLPSPPFFWREGEPTELLTSLEADLSEMSDLRLLTLDPAASLFGDNANYEAEVYPFLSYLNGMAKRLGCAIILSKHTSKSTTDRDVTNQSGGSVAWVFAARCAYRLKRDTTDRDKATLMHFKGNHSALSEDLELAWSAEGVLEHIAMPSHLEKQAKENAMARAIITECDTAWNLGNPFSAAANQTDRYILNAMQRIRQFKPKDTQKVVTMLEDVGALKRDRKTTRDPKGYRVVHSKCQKEWL